MSGPPPKHPSVRARRNKPKADFRTLPSAGREGEPPPWPLQPDALMTAELEHARDRVAGLQVQIDESEDARQRGRLRREMHRLELTITQLSLQLEQAADAEVALWSELWATPQAVMWEESHASREVAQYVRWKIRAEQGDMKAAAEARQLSDRLGLNPLALLRLRAEVQHVDEVEDKGRKRRESTAAPKPKRRSGGDDPRAGLYAVN